MNNKPDNIEHLIGRSEYTEGVALANYLRMLHRMGKIQLYTHINHEAYQSSYTARRKKLLSGTTRGFPDYVIVTKEKVLFIELKVVKGGTLSVEQKEWIGGLEGKQTVATVAKGYEAAKAFIDMHL